MKCTVETDKECNNVDLSKCENCIAPSWCFCTRKGANIELTAYKDFYESVSCLFSEGVEFMSKEEIYNAIKADWEKINEQRSARSRRED